MKAPFPLAVFRGLTFDAYRVTPDGEVWSIRARRFLQPYPSGTRGYPTVALRRDGKTVRVCVHRLVAEAFIGPCPDGFEVCHNDGSCTNNRATNLRYGTRAQNLSDRDAHGTSQRGARNPAAKLTATDVAAIRQRRASGEALKSLASAFGVRESAISRVANGQRWAQ